MATLTTASLMSNADAAEPLARLMYANTTATQHQHAAAILANSGAGAGDRNRTRNLLFTKQLLCQLSYAGLDGKGSGTLFWEG